MRLFTVVTVLIATMLSGSAWAETYIVPVWARALEGSDGTWWTQATAVNPNDFPVSVQITRVFPLRTTDCNVCIAESLPITVGPGGSASLNPPAGQAGRRLVAGAFEITTSGPVQVHLVAYRPGQHEIRQRLDTARAWLLPGTRSVSTVERTTVDGRMNVFIVNPAPAPLSVSLWSGNRAENEVRAVIAAGTTAVVALPHPRCDGAPCPIADVFPPPLLQVHIEADAPFLASVSSLGTNWAVFSLADQAAIAP